MKKALCTLLALVLTLTVFVSCQKKETEVKKEPAVMTVSLNPEVEFVLDENGAVVSANALNEEGNLVLEGQTFVGKDSEAALKLFISVSKENGFLLEGSADESEIKIAFSGEDADKRFNAVKTRIEEYLDKEKISAKLTEAKALSDEYLKAQLEKCLPYVEEAKIAAMTEQEKIAALLESRKETANLYSEQVKAAYYEAKEMALEQAKLDYVKNHANAAAQIAFDVAFTAYNSAADALEAARTSALIAEDSPYQTALADFRSKKAEFLVYRDYVNGLDENEVTPAMRQHLTEVETALTAAETALDSAYSTANASIDAAKNLLDQAYQTAVATIQKLDSNLQTYLDEAGEQNYAELENFTSTFETEYSEQIAAARASWVNMKNQIKAGYQETEPEN